MGSSRIGGPVEELDLAVALLMLALLAYADAAASARAGFRACVDDFARCSLASARIGLGCGRTRGLCVHAGNSGSTIIIASKRIGFRRKP